MARCEDLRGWFEPSDKLLLDKGFERALYVNDKRLFPGSVLCLFIRRMEPGVTKKQTRLGYVLAKEGSSGR